ncbi:MAG: hypothetical protein QOI21_3607 [Actinomycetota bacterium]|jgi:GNAT superfamily N-acetyltransferase|nr:hypothetical protein [Actinomycetota bacterium]
MPQESLDIKLLPATAAADTVTMKQLAELINMVYASAEKGLWLDGADRTTVDEVTELTRAGQIAVARLGDRIVGSVRVRLLDSGEGEFGILAADPDLRGTGIGRELVLFAERTCRDLGVGAMQLELLVPREWKHPSKEFLDSWYTRLGYRVIRTGTIDETYPALEPLLATPCDFLTYRKDLT